MTRLILLISLVVMFAIPTFSFAVTLDEVFLSFQKCEFRNLYYAPWITNEPLHPYLSERKLKPYKELDGLYYFKVKDTLFGLPVSEIIIPGTYDLHGVIFDMPLTQTRAVLKRKFGKSFAPSQKSKFGIAPALGQPADASNRSILYCDSKVDGL
jgi:hypothetical protein